eukprot:gene18090-27860_t
MAAVTKYPRICALTMFNFPYGCVCTTMGLFILPEEANRLFPANKSLALGLFLLIVGISQLVCPLVGLVSDRCTSMFGRRRPFILLGSLGALGSLFLMRYSSLYMYPYCFAVSLLVAMTCLNVIYSAQCGLVPDMVHESKLGTASGLVAVQQLLGSFTGFLCVLRSSDLDIHLSYPLYQMLLVLVVSVVLLAATEQPIDGPCRLPSLREVARSYTIDTSANYDFFWVFVSRTFFYAAVSCQAFMLFYIKDVVGTKDDALAREQMSTIALIGQFTACLVAFPVGGFSDTQSISRKSMIYFACAVMACVYVMFISAPVFFNRPKVLLAVYATAAVYGVGNGCYLAVDYALALDVLPSKSTSGQDLGVWGIAAFLGSSIGPVMWGAVLKLAGKEGD